MREQSVAKGPIVIGVLALLCCLAGAAWLYDAYYFAVRWPAKVQQETLGATIGGEDELISKERHFDGYGEGFARWRYRVEPSTPALQHLCGGAPVRDCSFSRSRKIEEGVDLYVNLAAGILTVQEWWS